MQAGDFEPGARVLRAKIDMALVGAPDARPDPLPDLGDGPAPPHRADAGTSTRCTTSRTASRDAIEGITHSLCTLEFADHRPLYEWVLDALEIQRPRPEQTEFARGNLSHTVVSKRVLRRLVEEGHVRGWDDPRMPTLAGRAPRAATRRRRSARFWTEVGVARRENLIELARLEAAVRDELNRTAPRAMAVLRPLQAS